MSTRETVLQILNDVKPTINLEGVYNIIDGGYLDSLELMSLISNLMNTFNIEVDIEYITPENFNSIDSITRLVNRLIQ